MERLTAGTATDIMLEEPHQCPHCQRFSHWFRNQNGRTVCIDCVLDLEELSRRATAT
jgi:ligand-binding SRPBCC domain-containing protein